MLDYQYYRLGKANISEKLRAVDCSSSTWSFTLTIQEEINRES